MKYNIHVTQAAERDMANAYDYIDLVLKNPTAADKLLDVADEKIGALAEFPHKFEVVSDKLLSLWGIRFTIVMNYLAFYTVDDATQTVHIVRFLYRTDTNWQVNATKRACLSGRGYCPNAVHQPAGSLYTVQHNNGFPCAAYRYFDPSQQGQL